MGDVFRDRQVSWWRPSSDTLINLRTLQGRPAPADVSSRVWFPTRFDQRKVSWHFLLSASFSLAQLPDGTIAFVACHLGQSRVPGSLGSESKSPGYRSRSGLPEVSGHGDFTPERAGQQTSNSLTANEFGIISRDRVVEVLRAPGSVSRKRDGASTSVLRASSVPSRVLGSACQSSCSPFEGRQPHAYLATQLASAFQLWHNNALGPVASETRLAPG